MGSFLLTLITGVAAGAWAARAVARREVEALRAELRPPKQVAPPPAPPVHEEITPETLMVLTAAVAAFLGKKAKIKRVTRATVSGSAWAQQGRVFVQASHNLQHHR